MPRLLFTRPRNRVVNALMKIIHQFPKTGFRNEIGGSFELRFDVFEKHGIVKTVGTSKPGIRLAIMIVTLNEIFHVIALGQIRANAGLGYEARDACCFCLRAH